MEIIYKQKILKYAHKKNTIIILILIFLFSCNKEKKSTFDVKYFQKHKIAFANSEIFLPKNFKKTEIKDYILLIKDEDFLFDKNNLFEKLESSPFEKLVFYDINNYTNVIFIIEGEYIYIYIYE